MCDNDERPGDGAPTRLQQYDMAYAQITHENDLIGHRITWFLTFQGFLFTAVFVAVSLYVGKDYELGNDARSMLAKAVGVLMVLAVLSCAVCLGLIVAANAHIQQVEAWWICCAKNCNNEAFPPIRGGSRFVHAEPCTSGSPPLKKQPFLKRLNAASFVVVIAVAWMVLGVMLLATDFSPPVKCDQRGLTAEDRIFPTVMFDEGMGKRQNP